jgi:hypothetical protein
MRVHRKSWVLTLSVIILITFPFEVQWGFGNLAWASGDSQIHPDPVSFDANSPSLEDGIYSSRHVNDRDNVLSAGYISGSFVTSTGFDSAEFVAFTHETAESSRLTHLFSLEATTNSMAGVSIGVLRLFDLSNSYEPYLEARVGSLFLLSEGLATFINWQRLELSGEAGFQDFLSQQRRYRLLGGLRWSPLGTAFYASVGYAF